jgi:hypothetical protein
MAGQTPQQTETPEGSRNFAVHELYGDLHNWIHDITAPGQASDSAGNLIKLLALLQSCDDETKSLVIEIAIWSAYLHANHFRDSLKEYLAQHCSDLLPGRGTVKEVS